VRFERGGGIAINEDRERDSRNTIHDSVDKFVRETHGSEGVLEKRPFNSVIGLCHVKFDTHIAMFFGFGMFKVMESFIG
jgi:hypothetical protein